MLDLKAIVRGSDALDALPGTALRLTSILAEEDWQIGDIVHAIQHDLALTGKLLKLANSSLAGTSGSADTVGEAIMRVGTGPVVSLAVGAAAKDTMVRPLLGLEEGQGTLWRHSVASALAITHAGKHCGALPPQECFVAALLHDVGFLALDRWLMSVPFGQERSDARDSIAEADHGVVAGMIAERWNLTESIQESIVFHHDPAKAPSVRGRLIASFVSVADCVAKTIGEGFGAEVNRLDPATARLIQLNRKGFEAICESTQAELDAFLDLYS